MLPHGGTDFDKYNSGLLTIVPKKRLLIIITSLTLGGAQSALFNLLKSGLADNFNCHVISLTQAGHMTSRIQELGVPVTSVGVRTICPSPHYLVKLYKLAWKIRPDIIQGWMYHGNLVASLIRKTVTGRPSIAWNIRHSLYNVEFEKTITRQVIRANRYLSHLPNALLYNSRLSKSQHEEFGFDSINGLVIPNGIDINQFSFSSTLRQQLLFELGIPNNSFVIGHVARFHPMKDHPVFLQAAVDIANRFPKVYIVLVGSNVSFENQTFVDLIPANMRHRFHLLGERQDIPALMNIMNLLVSSSCYGEGFSNVIGEAMSRGIPCVATDIGDSTAIIGNTGKTLPPRDKHALIAGMESFINMPEERRYELGSQARERIKTHFSLEKITHQYIELYNLLSTKKRTH